MPSYGYVDESGTKDDQQCMTVVLVVFAGAHTAEHLNLQIARELYPERFKKSKTKSYSKMNIHYADLDHSQKSLVSNLLSQAKVSVFASTYRHQGRKNHQEYFSIYERLVHQTVESALKEHKELVVTIGKQGGWQTYQKSFLASLKDVTKKFATKRNFAKAKFILDSVINPGIQLADFYAGALRENILSNENKKYSSSSYELLTNQYRAIENINRQKQ